MNIARAFAIRMRNLNNTVELRRWVVITCAVIVPAGGASGAMNSMTGDVLVIAH